jgi:kynureninase
MAHVTMTRDTMTRAALESLDATDPLAPMRAQFSLPEGVIYLDGNSLGAMPRATAARVAEVVQREWGQGLIRSWNDAGWIDLPGRVGDKIARLIGGDAGSVMVADSTSVNLFKLLSTALFLRPDRKKILSEAGNFPTDLYIAEGLRDLLDHGHRLDIADTSDIIAAIDENTAVVMLTHVNFHSGRMLDMGAITRAAHAKGALMLWDLAHSAGAMPIDLAAHDVDLAVGCGYKYLNGGPGAPAFLYVAPRLQDIARFPITGWLGHAQPFAFEPGYRPATGIQRAVVGTPPVISLAALEVGVDLALSAELAEVRAKSVMQTEIFARLIVERCAGHGLVVASPLEPSMRGSQVCLAHPHAYAIMQALIARSVIGDFRAPDILRFGMTPLYLGFAELWDAVTVINDVMATRAWQAAEYQTRSRVT